MNKVSEDEIITTALDELTKFEKSQLLFFVKGYMSETKYNSKFKEALKAGLKSLNNIDIDKRTYEKNIKR